YLRNTPAMLSDANRRRLHKYLSKVAFVPLHSRGELLRESMVFMEDLKLFPNQFAYIIDISNGTIPTHKGFDTFLGYADEKIDLEFLFGLFHPEDVEDLMNLITQAYDYGFSLEQPSPFCVQFMVTYRIRKADGSYIKVMRQSTLFQVDREHGMISTVSMCSDITHIDGDKRIKFSMHGEEGKPFEVSDLRSKKTLQKFTRREAQLVSLISNGYSTKQIAAELGTSVQTVETQRKNMLRKYNLANTFQLVFWAKENNLI
ncbi:MAG TPA: LuxR C-terminal-related transcriptional regulator, partial [Bacteroidia bacterium]|nr:LuxR C-terminal-related transcriptional regulator [Bacteroidia bacterium]